MKSWAITLAMILALWLAATTIYFVAGATLLVAAKLILSLFGF